jgi:hypothetical protein
MANGTPETFPLRGHPRTLQQIWSHNSAVDGVDSNGKVADIKRKMPNNPDRSRKEWAETRTESRKVAADQHHFEMESNRQVAAAQAKYKKETFDRIYENEIKRTKGMQQFFVDPTSYNDAPFAPGFSE